MSVINHINHQAARNRPENTFDSPQALVEEIGLTRGEKIAALETWRFDVQRRLDSASEGMAPEPEASGDINNSVSPLDRDADLLRKIDVEIENLREPDNQKK